MSEHSKMNRLLSPFRVLDLTDKKGYFCSKILGDLDAEVIRVERPGTKRDFWWWAYNWARSWFSLISRGSQRRCLGLAWEVDFLIESFPQDTSTWGWDTRP